MTQPIFQDTIAIRTPEGVHFQIQLAGPLRRFLAWAVDTGIFMAIASAAGGAQTLGDKLLPALSSAVSLIFFFVLYFGYNIAFEWFWSGKSPGKHLFNIRVMDIHGLRLRFSQVLMRNLMRLIDVVPTFYAVGLAAMLLNRNNQRLGDLAANTIVVYTPKRETPDVRQILAGKFNSFRLAPHLEARLRQNISPEVSTVLLDALLRRDELDPQARVNLYQELADFLRALVPFPDTITEGLSDEQYLRNTLETLYRNRTTTEKST